MSSSTPTSPGYDTASAWLASAPEPVRATILRHLTHHKLAPENGQLASPQQLAMIEKALGEHHAVLLPSFRRSTGIQPAVLPASHMGYLERKLLGEEDAFLRTHTDSYITTTDATLGHATIALPQQLGSREDATQFARSVFSSRVVNASPAPVDGRYTITIPVYDLKRDVDRIRKPVGFRALPTHRADERMVMEEEFRVMMGQDAPPREREMEALVQDVGMKKALEELTKDYRLMFGDNLKNGVYIFPVKSREALIARGVHTLLESGALSPNDVAFVGTTATQELHITPNALTMVEHALLRGIHGKTQQIPAATSQEATHARRAYFDTLSMDDTRRGLIKQQLSTMSADERAQAGTLIASNDNAAMHDRAALLTVGKAIESITQKREANAAKGTPRYDQESLRRGIAYAQAVLKEDRLWKHLDNAQLASHHNTVREDHSEALAQLDGLLASQPYSQAGLAALIATPRFAEAIRDSGHFLSIVSKHSEKLAQGQKAHKSYDTGAADYAKAFQLSDAAMVPHSSEAKSASYHLRAMVGDVSTGEVLGRNLFMGLRPIISSVELAVKKPVLCGATVLGIAAYSAVVPKQYSIPANIMKLVDKMMASFGIAHSHDVKGAQKMKKVVDDALENVLQTATTSDAKKWFGIGRKFGVGQTAATAAVMFIGFNLVEDVIVHLPLALVSVGVGAAGGATGRKVLSPVINDFGDLAGRIAPEAVRDTWRADKKSFASFTEQPWMARIGHTMRTFGHDVDELGILVTGRHAVSSAVDGVSHLIGTVLGHAKTVPTVSAAR